MQLLILKNENVKVIDVALKYGYDSPTAFSRAFQMIHEFTMDGEEFKKCKNMAFFHSLTEENYDAIKRLIRSELGE